MAATSTVAGVGASPAGLQKEEQELAYRAAAGDGGAFAELYDRYERRIFTFCQRLCSSVEDAADATQEAFLKVLQRLPKLSGRELNFSSYLYTAARNASYDVINKRKRSEPVADIPDPVGPQATEPGDLFIDPERSAMLASQQQDIRVANARLPERQREALALREIEDLSYDEIAEIIGANRNTVAQLISRARINLRDEMRGTALASVAVTAPDCEQALPLIAMREDGQLKNSDKKAWLEGHLSACENCRTAQAAMQEAGSSYRAWAPVLPLAVLRQETIAKAAEVVNADWSQFFSQAQGSNSAASGGVASHSGSHFFARLVARVPSVAFVGGGAFVVTAAVVVIASGGITDSGSNSTVRNTSAPVVVDSEQRRESRSSRSSERASSLDRVNEALASENLGSLVGGLLSGNGETVSRVVRASSGAGAAISDDGSVLSSGASFTDDLGGTSSDSAAGGSGSSDSETVVDGETVTSGGSSSSSGGSSISDSGSSLSSGSGSSSSGNSSSGSSSSGATKTTPNTSSGANGGSGSEKSNPNYPNTSTPKEDPNDSIKVG